VKNKLYKIHKLIITVLILLSLAGGLFVTSGTAAAETGDGPVYVLEFDGAVTAGLQSFLERQVENAEDDNAQLFVLVMNTPGGLVDATLKINELILNADLPVAVLVAPSGAIAGSAGAFILVSSDIAAMAPGTTVGAAMPVAISPEGTEATDEKTVQFYASHMRSMAREQGRPEDLAEQFVTENLTLSSREALEEGMIEYLVGSVPALLEALDGTEIEKQGITYQLNTRGAEIKETEMNLRESLQNWVSDPQIAFLILMLGILGIYFGLSAPGTIVPEVSGLILLILGIYGIGLFDTNTTGIIMMLLGAGLIAAEIFTSGFGILGIGGAASLLAGAILLPTEPLMARDWYSTFLVTVVGTVIGLLIIVLVVAQRVIHSRRKHKSGSTYFMPPDKGVVVEEINPNGMVRARGELWRAHSSDNQRIPKGTEVEIVRAESLKLWVRPVQNTESQNETAK